MVGYRGWETNMQAMFLRTTLVGTGLKPLAGRMSGDQEGSPELAARTEVWLLVTT